MKSILSLLLLFGSVTFAGEHKKAEEMPECAAIGKACETAGFKAGDYKKGKGLWIDCIAPLSKGKTIEGVSGVTAEDAKKCRQAARDSKKQTK